MNVYFIVGVLGWWNGTIGRSHIVVATFLPPNSSWPPEALRPWWSVHNSVAMANCPRPLGWRVQNSHSLDPLFWTSDSSFCHWKAMKICLFTLWREKVKPLILSHLSSSDHMQSLRCPVLQARGFIFLLHKSYRVWCVFFSSDRPRMLIFKTSQTHRRGSILTQGTLGCNYEQDSSLFWGRPVAGLTKAL